MFLAPAAPVMPMSTVRVLLVVCVVVLCAQAAVHDVSDATAFTNACATAANGDEIRLADGTYTVSNISITTGVSIYSLSGDRSKVTITCVAGASAFLFTSGNSFIEDLTITGCGSSYVSGGAINIANCQVNMSNVYLNNNNAANGGHIYVSGSSGNAIVYFSLLTAGKAENLGGAVFIDQGYLLMRFSTIKACQAVGDPVIHAQNGATFLVGRSSMMCNSWSGNSHGFGTPLANTALIRYSDVCANQAGLDYTGVAVDNMPQYQDIGLAMSNKYIGAVGDMTSLTVTNNVSVAGITIGGIHVTSYTTTFVNNVYNISFAIPIGVSLGDQDIKIVNVDDVALDCKCDAVLVNVVAPGSTCQGDAQCSSGLCAGTVCCDSLCNQACHSCVENNFAGQCTAVTTGDPGEMCGTCKMCDGSSSCASMADHSTDVGCTGCSECRGGTCSAVVCPNNFVCSGTACLTSCTSTSDCVTGFVCATATGECKAPCNDTVCKPTGYQCDATTQACFTDCTDATADLRCRGGGYFCINGACQIPSTTSAPSSTSTGAAGTTTSSGSPTASSGDATTSDQVGAIVAAPTTTVIDNTLVIGLIAGGCSLAFILLSMGIIYIWMRTSLKKKRAAEETKDAEEDGSDEAPTMNAAFDDEVDFSEDELPPPTRAKSPSRKATPTKKTPAKAATPTRKTPAKGTPTRKTPARRAPQISEDDEEESEDSSRVEDSSSGLSNAVPASRKNPARKTPAKGTPVKKTPAKGTPVRKTPAKSPGNRR